MYRSVLSLMLFPLSVLAAEPPEPPYAIAQATCMIDGQPECTADISLVPAKPASASALLGTIGYRWNASLSANGKARGDFGAVALSIMSKTIAHYDGGGRGTATANASARAAFSDWVTITSDSLPPGTPVTVQFTARVAPNIAINRYRDGELVDPAAAVHMYFSRTVSAHLPDGTEFDREQGISCTADYAVYGDPGCTAFDLAPQGADYTRSFMVPVGGQIKLTAGLSAVATSRVEGRLPAPNVTVNGRGRSSSDAGVTVFLSSDSDVSLVGQTGHDYRVR